MTTHQEKLAYNHVRKAKESLFEAIEWIDKIEQEKGTMLIPQGRKLANIYESLKKSHIEIIVLEKDLLETTEV